MTTTHFRLFLNIKQFKRVKKKDTENWYLNKSQSKHSGNKEKFTFKKHEV